MQLINTYANAPMLTAEKFEFFAKNDKTLHSMAYPIVLTKANGWPWDKTLSFTYPTEYEMTQEQVDKAKQLAQQRHDEQLAMLKPGVLAWTAMGGDFNGGEDGIGNYRVRCRFANSKGHVYFVELLVNPNGVVTDCVCDEVLRAVREAEIKEAWSEFIKADDAYMEARSKAKKITDKSERIAAICALKRPKSSDYQLRDPQDYYLPVSHKPLGCKPTFTDIMNWVNDTFNCSYHTSTMFNYFVDCDEYVCHCKSTKN